MLMYHLNKSIVSGNVGETVCGGKGLFTNLVFSKRVRRKRFVYQTFTRLLIILKNFAPCDCSASSFVV